MPTTLQPLPTTPSWLPPPQPSPPKHAKLPWLIGGGSLMLVLLPVVLLAGAANQTCPGAQPGNVSTPTGAPAPGGMYAQPLKLKTGRWYAVGATQYGGPSDPTSSSYGAIGAPGQSYLPAHPDTFAELSVLDHNPANSGTFTFADANALNNLPYMTALIVANNGAKRILYKRDVGYGQGPGQLIANGQPYRLDVWWQSAGPLRVSKNPVKIALAPPLGAGNLLQQTSAGTATGATVDPACDQLAATAMLKLTAGQRARILSNGSAAAPQDAPAAVKRAIAAANRIHTSYYRAERPEYLDRLYPWYDCSASTAYVLYHAGLNGTGVTVGGTDAGNGITLEDYGEPGPGRWISVYGNSTHAFIVIAGLAFDTADFGGPNIPAGSGPRWRSNPTGNLADGMQYVVRHPPGL
ncbi:MAG: hypothetical protein WBP81_19165 [Solirubrobacteraceae bacterium]